MARFPARRSKYSDSQVVSILKEAKAGQPVKEICRNTDQLGLLLPVDVKVWRLKRLGAEAGS